MAEAYGKLTGRPGICFVTRGPGATHASVGIHNAWQASTPMILFVGQVPRRLLGRDAFQELDLGAVFGTTAKWVGQPGAAGEVPEVTARAFAEALRGRPAPVVIGLPEDVLDEQTDAPDAEPVEVPRPAPADAELRRVYEPELAIVAALPEFAAALRGLEPVDSSAWREWTAASRADYLDNLRHRPPSGNGVDLGEVVAFLRKRLPKDAILATGAGNFTTWAHRFYEFSRYGTQLAPQSGAMGYGVPAALAAKAVHPDRLVVCIAGDGDFLMSGQELATAVQYELPIVVL